MKNPKDSDKKPSAMFVNALSGFGVGSDHITCDWCGREHMCPDTTYTHYDDDITEEESIAKYREYCEEEHRKHPDGVVLHYECDSVSGQELNGIMFVIGCPCNGLTRYEEFIWENKDTIRNYLKVRIEQEHRWAEEQLTLNKLAGISK